MQRRLVQKGRVDGRLFNRFRSYARSSCEELSWSATSISIISTHSIREVENEVDVCLCLWQKLAISFFTVYERAHNWPTECYTGARVEHVKNPPHATTAISNDGRSLKPTEFLVRTG